jgi:hypothetical protein
MSFLLLDAMDNAAAWRALNPDGVTPSSSLTFTSDTTRVRFGTDTHSGRITADTGALNSRLQRTFAGAGIDLTNFDELRLWIWSNRLAAGTADAPFFLEVRLASAAMGLQDAGNTWVRYLPILQGNTWEFVRLSLDDLPTPIRSALTLLQLRCVDASVAFTCSLADILAVHEEMIADVDNALLAQLHQQLSIAGTKVPALFEHPENPSTMTIPSIRITQYDIQYDSERTSAVQARSDFTATTFRVRPRSIAYSLYFALDVYADTREHKDQIMEFVLRTLSPASYLLVNGTQLPLEWMTISPFDDTGKWRSNRELLYFRVLSRQEIGTAEQVTPPYKSISLAVDQPS